MNGKIARIHGSCAAAIKDIQDIIKRKDIQISEMEASRLLGEVYFKLKKEKKPKIIWDFP